MYNRKHTESPEITVNQIAPNWSSGTKINAGIKGATACPVLPPTRKIDCDKPRRGPAARKATRDPSGGNIADPQPINHTLIRIVGKEGANASSSIPNILLVKPNGSAYGMGRLSVYIPTTGCITEETMLSVNAMSPSCVKDSPRDFSKIGNIAGITAC